MYVMSIALKKEVAFNNADLSTFEDGKFFPTSI